jgi:hypothetical protein
MAFGWISRKAWATKKTTSQGQGGRGRSTKISTSTMNKRKRASHKAYRGQGR